MRILYVITYYLPHVSGLTLGLVPLAESMAGSGADVRVLAAQHDGSLARSERITSVEVTRVPVAAWVGKGPIMPSFTSAVWRAAKDADIVHLILPQFDAGPAALAARLRGRKVVLTYVCSLTAPGIVGRLAVSASQASHFLAGLLAHRIVALSEDYAGQSRFCRLFRRKLSYIELPIPDYPDRAVPRRPPRPPFRIGFVGRIAPEKNLHLLLDAVPHLRRVLNAPFTLEIVGPIDRGGSRAQRELVQRIESETAPELRRIGPLSGAALDQFYREIDVLVLPSTDRIEAFGLVQVEAMLRGVPCVTSDRPGMRQPILKSGFGRLFQPGDVEAFVEAVGELLGASLPSDPGKLHETFRPDKVFAEYARLYEEVSQGRRSEVA